MPQILNALILKQNQFLTTSSESHFPANLQSLFILVTDFMPQVIESFVSFHWPNHLLSEVNLIKFLFQFRNV